MKIILLNILLGTVLTEAITGIVTKSEIFRPLRKLLFDLGQDRKIFLWFHNLLDCGYCFSVWAGTLSSFLLFRDSSIFVCLLLGLVLHRLSNILHDIIDRYL